MSDGTCGGNGTSLPRGTMIQSTILWFPCDVWLRNRAVHTISSYVIQVSFPNSPIVKHYHVRFRSAFTKILSPGKNSLNLTCTSCAAFCFAYESMTFSPVLGRRRVNRVRNSRPRNRLAGVLPVVGCLVDRYVSKKLPIRC